MEHQQDTQSLRRSTHAIMNVENEGVKRGVLIGSVSSLSFRGSHPLWSRPHLFQLKPRLKLVHFTCEVKTLTYTL